ncbi:hypothetical protein [Chromobacterium haemolyticum]|uniref:hypothetical protein n=1 Tax=Chromobacterium haemolyticum TaxID=394935 RepID=UPI002448D5DC|nr:hypothetical protein [Chromobacterium haemolyticum]MDH0341626.1 hypothetical protein [Chromobacterium haemolyticum]
MGIISSVGRSTGGAIVINGRPVAIRHHTWQVIDRQTWSKTRVELSGGSTYIGPYGGYVEPPQLTSRVTEQQEIWLRDEHGKEVPLRLSNGGFPVRVGHRVVISGVEIDGHSWLVELQNVDTGSRKQMMPNWGQLLNQAGILRRPAWTGLTEVEKGLRIIGIALLSWLFASLMLFNAAKIGFMPDSRAEHLQEQVRALNSQSMGEPDRKTRRVLEGKAGSLQRELDQASAKERDTFLMWLNGLGISLTLGTLLWLNKGTGRYRRQLAEAEQQLNQALCLPLPKQPMSSKALA